MVISLVFEARGPEQKPASLRRAGKVPAVFYGKKQKSTPISVSKAEFTKVWKQSGENAVVALTGPSGEVEAVIHDVERHPVSGEFRHIDFYVFEKGQTLKVKVPIEFIGVAPAVKELGAVLVKVLRELEIAAEPKRLPHSVEADLSPLSVFGAVILAKEITLPDGVALLTNPDEVVASVYEPKEEVVEAPPPDLSQIEVLKKGKEAPPAAGEEAAAQEAPRGGAAPAPAAAEAKEAKKEAKKQ